MAEFKTTLQLARLPKLSPRDGHVRLVKDLLRVGKWHVGDDADGNPRHVEFTAADLDAIESRFNEHKAAGIRHPLTWGHIPPGANDTDERQSIADIEDVFQENGTLYFTAYMPVASAAELLAKRRECSIGLATDWTDGSGNHWPGMSLIHGAVVAHAVVPGQHPFIEMGYGRPSREPSAWDRAIVAGRMRQRVRNQI